METIKIIPPFFTVKREDMLKIRNSCGAVRRRHMDQLLDSVMTDVPVHEEVARKFAELLAKKGVPLEEVVRINKEVDSLSCASHDFCDANLVMDQAYQEVMHTRKLMPAKLWTITWNYAKEQEFFIHE